jgi:hypothetical protein
MKFLILIALFAIVQTAPPVPKKATNSSTHTASEIRKSPATDQNPPAQAPSPLNASDFKTNQTTGNYQSAPNTEQSIRVRELPTVSTSRDWIDKLSILFTGILVIVGSLGVCAAYRTLRAIERQARIMRRQTRHIARQALSMRRQTTHLRNSVETSKASVDALIATERAWIDGELICHHDLGIYRYTLKIRNLGRTPAQIRSYEISVGPLTEEGSFTLDDWSSRKTKNLHIFLGSGETEPLEQGINMDEIFPTNDSNCMWKAPYRVAIRYADVVTGTPEDRPEHLTSFVYLYWPFMHGTERVSIFNQYT